MRPTEIWRARLAATHTIVREGRAVERFVLSHRLAQLTVPVRFLLGTESPAYLRASTEAAHAAIPGSDVVDLAGQAHMAMDTVPAEFAHLVIQFCHPGP
jgi:pimeloyl-ACP methyl ester carboxylesterase